MMIPRPASSLPKVCRGSEVTCEVPGVRKLVHRKIARKRRNTSIIRSADTLWEMGTSNVRKHVPVGRSIVKLNEQLGKGLEAGRILPTGRKSHFRLRVSV